MQYQLIVQQQVGIASAYCDGVGGCHVLRLYTVIEGGCHVLSVYCDGEGVVMSCLYTVMEGGLSCPVCIL